MTTGISAAARPGTAALALFLFLLLTALPAVTGCGGKKADENNPSKVELAITEYQQGTMLLNNGRFEEALGALKRAVALDGNKAIYHGSVALALFRLQRYDEAMASVDRALELNPEYIEAYNIRGMIYNEQGEYLQAMSSFRHLIESPSYGKPWVAYYNLGFAAASAGNEEEALFYYSRALEQKNDYVQARHQRGLMLERLGREAEAIREYEMVIDAVPESAEVHFSLGRLYFRAGRTTDARVEFEWVMRYAPGTDYSTRAARYLNMMEQAGH